MRSAKVEGVVLQFYLFDFGGQVFGADRRNFQAVNPAVLIRSQHSSFVIETHRHPGTFFVFRGTIEVFGHKIRRKFQVIGFGLNGRGCIHQHPIRTRSQ